LLGWNLSFDLRPALHAAASHLPIEANPQHLSAAADFITERLRYTLLEQGDRYDVVEAVLIVQGYNPARAGAAVKQLQAWTARPD
jgi:glycyl-tRNA synthetase beta subunit